MLSSADHDRLVRSSNLIAVRLIGVDAKFNERSFNTKDLVLNATPRAFRVGTNADQSMVVCANQLLAELKDQGNEIIMRVDAEYRLEYQVSNPGKYDEKSLHLFAARNGVFHAWPFFRELVHSLGGRFGIPQLLTPLLQLAPLVTSASVIDAEQAQSPRKATASHRGKKQTTRTKQR